VRVTFGVGKRIWVCEAKVTWVTIDTAEDAGTDEGFEHAPVDPHSTLSCHAEISPHAVGVTDTVSDRSFGFHGSKG
jgi:hypothetical protein